MQSVLLCDKRSIMSGILHAIGVLFSVFSMTIFLIFCFLFQKDGRVKLCLFFFSFTMFLLYQASTIFHVFYISERVHTILRKVDHSMVFVLILGSYVPLCFLLLPKSLGQILFFSVLGLSLVGILLKWYWIDAPKWFCASIYICFGWAILFGLPYLYHHLVFSTLAWLFSGGIAYTIGAIIYMLPCSILDTPYLGNHEVFHVFILLGSLCHFIFYLCLFF